MEKTFSRCVASTERYQPIPNIKGKSASTHQKQSSKKDLLFLTKPNNVAGKNRYVFDFQSGRSIASLPALFQKKLMDQLMFSVGAFPCLLDHHVSNNTMSELLRHLCGKQKSILCPLATAHLQGVTNHVTP